MTGLMSLWTRMRIVAKRGAVALGLGAFAAAATPAMAEAACVATAINRHGHQIDGTRAVARGVFPRIVCSRALSRCEARLNSIRRDSGRLRRYARCDVVASGPRANSVFGPPLESSMFHTYPKNELDYDYKRPGRTWSNPKYDDYNRSDDYAYRGGGDNRGDNAYRDDAYGDDVYGGDYGDQYGGRCNYNACASRYKTFRSSDCSYKPNVYERRRCPL